MAESSRSLSPNKKKVKRYKMTRMEKNFLSSQVYQMMLAGRDAVETVHYINFL